MHLSAEQVGESRQGGAEHVFGAPDCGRLRGSHLNNQQGFTLVELITVMVIVGIIAVVAVPRFFASNTFESRGFYDQVISTLRYAQKAAIAQHRFVCVAFTANSIELSYGTTVACASGGLTSPSGQTPYAVTAPRGVTFISPGVGTTFSFNALGRPSAPPGNIQVDGYATSIIVEAETGYVHSN